LPLIAPKGGSKRKTAVFGVKSPLFCFISRNSIALQAYYRYVTVAEDRPILSAKYRPPRLAKTNPPCSAVSLR